jgi:hypothetical protein
MAVFQSVLGCGTVLKIGVCRLGVLSWRLRGRVGPTNSLYAARKLVLLQRIPSHCRGILIFKGHPKVFHK